MKFYKLFCLTSILFVVVSCTQSKNENSILIGHVAPLTGNQAHLGKDNELGFLMAIRDLNKQEIIIDNKPVLFEGLSEDDAADPKQGTAAAQKLIDYQVVGVIGHLNSGTTVPASAMYNRAEIPQISPSATLPKYTKQGFDHAFRVVANDVQLGGTLGKYSFKTLQLRTVAVIDDRTAYGSGVAKEFQKGFQSAGGKVIANEFTHDKATDFFAILTSIKEKNPDFIFFGGMDAVAGPMLRQLKQLDMNMLFFGGDGICTAELPRLAGDALGSKQVFCAEAGGLLDDATKRRNLAFRQRFQEENNVDVKLYAPYVYDATMILVEAMKKADSTDPKIFSSQISKVNYLGVTGPISFDKFGDVKNAALTIFSFQDGNKFPIEVVKSSGS